MILNSEKILYSRIRKKDKQAFIQAYDKYLDHIYRFILFKVKSVEEAEDLTSQVFLKAWDYIQKKSVQDYKSLKSLLYQVARNTVIDHYRKNSRTPVTNMGEGLPNLIDDRQDIAHKMNISSDYEFVSARILELKEDYRELLLLKYVNELSTGEIADILGKSRGNVRVMLYRALSALRAIIETEQDKKTTKTND